MPNGLLFSRLRLGVILFRFLLLPLLFCVLLLSVLSRSSFFVFYLFEFIIRRGSVVYPRLVSGVRFEWRGGFDHESILKGQEENTWHKKSNEFCQKSPS